MIEIGTFGKGNSGGKYRVDEVWDAANSADHNHSLMRHVALLLHMAWHGPCVYVYVTGISSAKQLNRPRCHLARMGPHNRVLDGVRIPPGQGQFCRWANMGMPTVDLRRGMDLWGDDAAFCQIILTSCLDKDVLRYGLNIAIFNTIQYVVPSLHVGIHQNSPFCYWGWWLTQIDELWMSVVVVVLRCEGPEGACSWQCAAWWCPYCTKTDEKTWQATCPFSTVSRPKESWLVSASCSVWTWCMSYPWTWVRKFLLPLVMHYHFYAGYAVGKQANSRPLIIASGEGNLTRLLCWHKYIFA